MTQPISVLYEGRSDYRSAAGLQEVIARDLRETGGSETLLLLEFDPVFTLGSQAKDEHILTDRDALLARGADIVRTDRGGGVTFHGPGQLVCYPILNLRQRGLGARDYVCRLEEVMIGVVGRFNLSADRSAGRPGVWLGEKKIGAVGVRISGGVSTHGFALNVDVDLGWFRHILPCGLTDARMTSVGQQLEETPSLEECRAALVQTFAAVFGTPLKGVEVQAAVAQESPVGG